MSFRSPAISPLGLNLFSALVPPGASPNVQEHPAQNPPKPEPPKPKVIICCFDGTGNKFGENSNVVRLFGALVKNKPDEQIVYYQPGIGTYNKAQYHTKTMTWLSSTLDQAVALHLNDHVKEGYQFIMQNYRPGDKICLFGFSRGAYTARVVMGMIYKVGVLPRDNIQQIDFAFSVYQMTGEHGRELSREFKKTFALPVTVEFVGVWDTVSSVGLVPRAHPYTSVNYAVKTFRHALALDECRARFRPKTWFEATLEREQELDVDEPELCKFPDYPRRDGSGEEPLNRDDWEYKPPNRVTADVEEVWFSGCHADVGGGSHHNRLRESLSYIPLRWMIKEVIVAQTGVLFDYESLQALDFDFDDLALELKKLGLDPAYFKLHLDENPIPENSLSGPTSPALLPASLLASPTPTLVESITPQSPSSVKRDRFSVSVKLKHYKDLIDQDARKYDQLELFRGWWILEVLPMLTTYQNPSGDWTRQRIQNFGNGRYMPFHNGQVLVHKSVQDRINNLYKPAGPGETYKPAASNWQELVDAKMVEWVY